jgi:hypothetical protein
MVTSVTKGGTQKLPQKDGWNILTRDQYWTVLEHFMWCHLVFRFNHFLNLSLKETSVLKELCNESLQKRLFNIEGVPKRVSQKEWVAHVLFYAISTRFIIFHNFSVHCTKMVAFVEWVIFNHKSLRSESWDSGHFRLRPLSLNSEDLCAYLVWGGDFDFIV